MNLQRLTTQYVDVQDRIRLTGELEGGEVVVWWITQRLLIRLVPLLTQWLKGSGAEASWAELMQSFAQQTAHAALEPQAPVVPKAAMEGVLLEAVDLAHTDAVMSLTLRGAGQQSKLHLEAVPLRQWLSILFQQWQASGWPADCWPDWLKDGVTPRTKSAAVLH